MDSKTSRRIDSPIASVSETWFVCPENRSFAEGKGRLVIVPSQKTQPIMMFMLGLVASFALPASIIFILLLFIEPPRSVGDLKYPVCASLLFVASVMSIIKAGRDSKKTFDQTRLFADRGSLISGEVIRYLWAPNIFMGGKWQVLWFGFSSPNADVPLERSYRWNDTRSYGPVALVKPPHPGQSLAILYVDDDHILVL